MQKILLVEDQPDFQMMVRALLEQKYQVLLASTVREALELVKAEPVDLVLLDVMLPDGNGFQLITQFRALPTLQGVPIVLLTSKSEIADRVAGFSLGADDYIVKPFEPLEFSARISAKLSARQSQHSAADVIQKGRVLADCRRYKAFVTGADGIVTDLFLTPHEFRLLVHFMSNEGAVLSRDQLIDAVWGQGVHVLERTIDRHVSSLRRKLGKGAETLNTIHGIGYRFTVETRGKKLPVESEG